MNKPYAVTFTYNFDDETVVYLFASEVEAREFFEESFLEEFRIDSNENGWDCSKNIISENHYQIINQFNDREDITDFRLGRVYN